MKSIAFHNLGCKVNSYEMDVMQQMSQIHDYEIVQFEQKADVYVINTCSVTNIADRKSRQMIHRAKKLNPEAVVVAVGCYVQTDTIGVAQDESVDLLIGNNHKKELFDILHRFFDMQKEMQPAVDTPEAILEQKTLNRSTVSDLRDAKYEEVKMTHTGEHTRAYIKIQDGCNRFCSYCVIPYARGRVRSRLPEHILSEIHGLVQNGYREFVFTGIHVSSYGLDLIGNDNGAYLLSLLQEVNAIDGVERIRLSSLEPMIITPMFVDGLGQIEKLCPHFHLSLQSGCDETLRRMNRRYTSGEYCEKVEMLRARFPEAAITTDVIVGFPGETKEEFLSTKDFLTKVGFYEMHVFKYSKRNGTKAATMPNQISDAIKAERSDTLLELGEKQSALFRAHFLAKKRPVLFEETKIIDGRSYWLGYTPEYVRVAYESDENCANVVITGVIDKFLTPDTMLMR